MHVLTLTYECGIKLNIMDELWLNLQFYCGIMVTYKLITKHTHHLFFFNNVVYFKCGFLNFYTRVYTIRSCLKIINIFVILKKFSKEI